MQLARVVITLDSKRVVPASVTAALHKMGRGGPVHYLTRTLLGSPGNVFQMPLCWDADAHERDPHPDDELWWLSVDHGTVDLAGNVGTYDRELITCSNCIEWLRA